MLFGRQVIFEVGQPGETGRQLTGLRIAFRVQMSRASTPNTATVEVYNPAPDSIAEIQKPGAVIRLLAGYDVPRLIFEGNATKQGAWLKQQGPDRILHFEGQDGGQAYRTARVDASWATETTLSQVLTEVAAQLGLPEGVVRTTNDIRFPQGISLRGPARDVLDRLAAAQSSDWFIRDGSLFLIQEDGDTGESVVQFSSENGNLIGSPAPKDDGSLEVTGLLEPSCRPGRKFSVRSRDFDGIYVAGDVTFQGDAGFDAAFYVTVTGRLV